jgi:two-component system response regulator AtoC
MLGKSEPMTRLFRTIEKAAEYTTTVLVLGESGTGKELVARALHAAGPRKNEAFIAINCGAIPETLLESELFGHKRGAFTDATSDKVGLFEAADRGTLFLDEIGELPQKLQVKLLRVLQEGQIRRLGDTKDRNVDVRVIAATLKDLRKEVAENRFREDLFYRINVLPLEVPPLRDRKEDVLPLAQFFIRKYNAENYREISENLSPEVLSLLENYYYPGNVRELENIIERAVVIAPTDELTVECLRPEVRDPELALEMIRETEGFSADIDIARGVNFYDEVKKFEIDLIRRALDQTGGHQSRAARLLGLNATTLNSKIKTYNIMPRI